MESNRTEGAVVAEVLDYGSKVIAVMTPFLVIFAVLLDGAYWYIVDPGMFRTLFADSKIAIITHHTS